MASWMFFGIALPGDRAGAGPSLFPGTGECGACGTKTGARGLAPRAKRKAYAVCRRCRRTRPSRLSPRRLSVPGSGMLTLVAFRMLMFHAVARSAGQ